ncbi:hypothetical protein N7488_004706 [Penicillium malachiteum]|nr:hypothetical protein N7488_004706 [Penicillium malachiteum]
MHLSDLSNELIFCICSCLNSLRDHNALLQTSRAFHALLNRELYLQAISKLDFTGVFWAAREGRVKVLQQFIEIATQGLMRASMKYDIQWRPRGPSNWKLTDDINDTECVPHLPSRAMFCLWAPEGCFMTSDPIPMECVYRNAMHDAIQHGQIEALEILIENTHEGLDCVDRLTGYGPYHLAAQCDQPEVIKFLVDKGVQICPPAKYGRSMPTPMEIAAKNGHQNALQVLCDHEREKFEDIEWKKPDSDLDDLDFAFDDFFRRLLQALHAAILGDQAATTKFLLEQGADPYNDFDHSPAVFMAALMNRPVALREILEFGVSPDGLNPYEAEETEESRFINRYTFDYYRDLLNPHFEPEPLSAEALEFECSTPLCAAVFMGHKEAVMVLLEYFADVNFVDMSGKPALHVALEHNHRDIAALLLQEGAKVDITDCLGQSAIQYALRSSKAGEYELIMLLLDHASPELRDQWFLEIVATENMLLVQ